MLKKIENIIINQNKDGKGTLDVLLLSITEMVGILLILIGKFVFGNLAMCGIGLVTAMFGGFVVAGVYSFIEIRIMMKHFESLE